MQGVFEQIFRREEADDFDHAAFKREVDMLDARGFFGNLWNAAKNHAKNSFNSLFAKSGNAGGDAASRSVEKKYEDALKRNVEHVTNELVERGWLGDAWKKIKESDLVKGVKEGGKKWLR